MASFLVRCGGWIVLLASVANGQSARFEVASVEISPSTAAMRPKAGMTLTGDRVEIRSLPMSILLMRAYRVEAYQISGPDWMSTQRFDIDAKLPEGATRELVPEMLRALLADRFKLVVRREAKEQTVYELVMGKDGPKLAEALPDASSKDVPRVVERSPMRFDADKISMPELALALMKFVDSPVIDKTGLKGYYQVSLSVPPPASNRRPGRGMDGTSAGAPAMSEVPDTSIFASIQKLGLRLEKRKELVEHIVVEHVEKVLSEN